MKRVVVVIGALALAILFAGCGSTTTASAPATSPTTTAEKKPPTISEVAAKVRGGVIRIESSACDGDSVGSGFMLTPRLIATVEHVVSGANEIVLKRDGKRIATAVVIGRDPARDLALLRTSKALPGYHFKLSSRDPQLGDGVVAFGFPLGLPLSISRGVVSGSDRTVPIDGLKRRKLIQTDAALNPGNSGGPLLDLETGRVVGLVDLGSEYNGVSFAVSPTVAEPLLRAWEVAPQPQSVSTDCAPPTSTNQVAAGAPPAQATSTDEQARQDIETLLYRFHEDLATANYSDAWTLLSARKRQQTINKTGYSGWQKAQASLTPYIDPQNIHAEIVDYDDTEQVALVDVTGMSWSAPGAHCSEWSGYTWVKYENGDWTYDPGYSTTPAREAEWKPRYAELLGALC